MSTRLWYTEDDDEDKESTDKELSEINNFVDFLFKSSETMGTPGEWPIEMRNDLVSISKSDFGGDQDSLMYLGELARECNGVPAGSMVGVKEVRLRSERDRRRVLREISALKKFESTFFIRLIKASDVRGAELGSTAVLFFEEAKGDLMFEVFLQPQHEISTGARVKLFGQMLAGVASLASIGFIHGNLRPDAILIVDDPTSQAKVRAKLADLSLCRRAQDEFAEQFEEAPAPLYTAPEVALGKVKQPGLESDVWALGLVLYEIVIGTLPSSFFEEYSNQPDVSKAIAKHFDIEQDEGLRLLRKQQDRGHNKLLVTLITGMLQRDPKQRLTAEDAVRLLVGYMRDRKQQRELAKKEKKKRRLIEELNRMRKAAGSNMQSDDDFLKGRGLLKD